MRGLYRGYWATIWRDVPAYGMFFFIYDYLQRKFIREKDSTAMIHFKKVIFAGLAGIFNWCPTYPADLIKSIIQCNENPKPLSILEVIREGYSRLGMKFFY